MSKHVAIWIDHKEARILHVHPDNVEQMTVTDPQHVHHKHPKGSEDVKEHPEDAKRFFHKVVRSVEESKEILLVGPSTAKLDFLRYVHTHYHALEPRIVGIETVDHPTDGQLIAYAKTYFRRNNPK